MKDPMVHNPPHYKLGRDLETIDVIEAVVEGMTAHQAFLTGNVLKYICRWNGKGGVQDLKKAKWYLERLINKEKGE